MDRTALSEMTVRDLRILAAGRGVPKTARMTKAELVEALLVWSATHARPPAVPAPATGAASSPASSRQAPPAGPAIVGHQAPTDWGLPVPDQYGLDRVALLVQDPAHLFAYWEVRHDSLEAAQAQCGGRGAPVLVIHGPYGAEQREIDLRGGNYYLNASPDAVYRVELALRAPDGRLIVLASSQSVRTPAAGVSWRTDEAWMEVDEAVDERLAAAVAGGLRAGAGSGERFRNARTIHARSIGEDDSLAAAATDLSPALAGRGIGGPSSLALGGAAGNAPSSLSLSSASLARRQAAAGGAGASSGQVSSRAVAGAAAAGFTGSSGGSRTFSSRVLSSRARSSGNPHGDEVVQGVEQAPALYPVQGVFAMDPTGWPKAADGERSHAPAPAPAPTGAPWTAPAPAPAAPAPRDPLAFVGAPKPAATRRGRAPRRR